MRKSDSIRPRNFNHPPKGASIKVDPIRELAKIGEIKTLLKDSPRDLCLFTLGINTAYRAGELLSLTVGKVRHLQAGDRLDLKQSKSGKYRAATLNAVVIDAIRVWLTAYNYRCETAPLFPSQRSHGPLTVSTVNNMVKRWCRAVGLAGNYGSHSMRKTWGFHQRVHHRQAVSLLMAAFGHTSEAQTLDYLGIQADEIKSLYEMQL